MFTVPEKRVCSGDGVQVLGGRDTVSAFHKQRDATLARDPNDSRSVLSLFYRNRCPLERWE